MATLTYKQVAEQILEAIKKQLLAVRKNGSKNAKVNLEMWNCKSGGETYDYIRVGDEKFGHFTRNSESGMCMEHLAKLLNEQKTKRGYKTLVFETHETGNYPSYYTIVDCVSLLEEACKEFTQLKKFIQKYTTLSFGDFDVYSVDMGGKRGELYGESGSRHYLAHNPNRCQQYLAQLRKNKSTKDVMTCKLKTETYIDEMERRCSAYYETECSGTKTNCLQVTIKTPNGKNKLAVTIC